MTNNQDASMASLFDLQAEITKRATAEVVRLRGRVKELEAVIAAAPATAWHLQERVTMLERLYSELKAQRRFQP